LAFFLLAIPNYHPWLFFKTEKKLLWYRKNVYDILCPHIFSCHKKKMDGESVEQKQGKNDYSDIMGKKMSE
jgi:hypothetical protein